jgi:hypothetical protein
MLLLAAPGEARRALGAQALGHRGEAHAVATVATVERALLAFLLLLILQRRAWAAGAEAALARGGAGFLGARPYRERIHMRYTYCL